MKKRKTHIAIYSFLLIFSISLSLFSVEKPEKAITPAIESYRDCWEKIDSHMKKGLTQTAIDSVDKIYARAKKTGNADQLIKALIFGFRLMDYKEENSAEKVISRLNAEIKESKFPVTPVLHSMLAECYWNYYQNNRWLIYNRTQTEQTDLQDIKTWDLRTIMEKIISEYELSLMEKEKLKQSGLSIYKEIIENRSPDDSLRTTLYDFLAHRAVDFFSTDDHSLTKPAFEFTLNSPDFFLPFDRFAKLDISTQDTSSLKFHAIRILQDLIAFHEQDRDPDALIDADLKRLSFARTHAVLSNKDSLYLSALVTLKNRFPNTPASAEVSYQIALLKRKWAGIFIAGQDEQYRWLNREALELLNKAIKSWPKSYGAAQCKALEAEIKTKDMGFTIESVNLPEKPFKTLLTYKNIDKVYWRQVKIDFQEYRELINNGNEDSVVNKLASLKPVKEWSTTLPLPSDYQNHSVELQMMPLPYGHYAILCSSSPDFTLKEQAVAYESVQISRLSYIDRQIEGGGQEFHILDRQSGHPVQGVTVKAWKNVYDDKKRNYKRVLHGTFLSDNNGLVVVSGTNSRNYSSYSLDLIKGNDRLYSYRQYSLYRYGKQKPQMNLRTFFFTDRAIYRPGQTIFFKGIVLRTDGDKSEIVPGHATTVRFINANGQEVSNLKLTTNKYGSFNGSFAAPLNALNGQMSITDDYGYVVFSVEDYKRPKFEVKLDPVKGRSRLGEKVTVNGLARAYATSPINGASVRYRVVRTARFPDWWWCWWRPSRWSSQMEITSGSTVTNDTGGFTIGFTALADKSIPESENPTFSYKVSVDVTDINGETRSSSGVVNVGYVSMTMNVDIGSQVRKESDLSFTINTANLNGTYEPSKGTIVIHRLKTPEELLRKRLWNDPDTSVMSKAQHESLFPDDPYNKDSDITKWPKGTEVFKSGFDTQKDKILNLAKAENWKSGVYVLEAEAVDQVGKKVKDIRYFTLYSEKEKTLPYKMADWFVPVKKKCEPGENAVFLIGTGYSDTKVLYEIEHKSQIVKKEWLNISNGQLRLEIPVEEKHRGNLSIHLGFVRCGRAYYHTANIEVPWTNKELDVSFETFRSSLYPGEKEEWRMKVSGKKKDKIAAEMVAALYDASLDAFTPHRWQFEIYPRFGAGKSWGFGSVARIDRSRLYSIDWNNYLSLPPRGYPQLNWFGYHMRGYSGVVRKGVAGIGYGSGYGSGFGGEFRASSKSLKKMQAAPPAALDKSEQLMSMAIAEEKALTHAETFAKRGFAASIDDVMQGIGGLKNGSDNLDLSKISARTNLNETAFFFPALETNEKGEIIVKFQIPEALTRWKLLGFTHTQNLEYGMTSNEITTRKDLMVMPNPPRFFRENDRITFTAKVSNISGKDLSGSAQLFLFDAASIKPVDPEFGNKTAQVPFTVKKGLSAPLSWELKIPEGIGAVTFKVVAKADNFSDGEEQIIPVLSNRTLVTESVPLPVRKKGAKNFSLPSLLSQNDSSGTMVNHRLTLEFTSNPAWYAIQALPYLMEYPYECSEQIFGRFYANSIASHIANSSPKIKAVFDQWRTQSPGALLSNLEKNQELKSLVLEETPWLLDGKNETEQKQRVALLFDLNKLANEKDRTLTKLKKLQLKNGGWPWFEGGPDDRYITQYIAIGLGRLDHLGVLQLSKDHGLKNMTKAFLDFLDNRIREDYEQILKHGKKDANNLSEHQIQYLYMRSFFKDMPVDNQNKTAFSYFFEQSKKYWFENSRYMQGMIALALNRYGDTVYPAQIVRSLKENSITSEEMGMYWKEMYQTRSWWWYEAPIESQALMVEVFQEVANDTSSVEDLKAWLLKSKQTQNWRTTRATAEACYALLLRGTDWLQNPSTVSIKLGEKVINTSDSKNIKAEAGTGYFKKSWTASEISPDMGNITVTKQENGVAWGSLYWQYFEQMDKIKPSETPLKINKKLFIQKDSPVGKKLSPVDSITALKPGDKLTVRIELRVDRDMEYVHMKDMRASGFEPLNVFSGYRWQDRLGYYESTRDAATNFFFSRLNKGTYVFEYPLVVSHSGDFSNGITTIQCMYAPEFTSYSKGVRVVAGSR